MRIYARTLDAEEVGSLATSNPLADILAIPPADRTALENERLVDAYLREHVNGAHQLFLREQDLRQTMARLENQFPSTLVMQERHTSRDAHVLLRGQYDQKGEKVQIGL